MPHPNSACIPFPDAPIISQFIHVSGGKKGDFKRICGRSMVQAQRNTSQITTHGQCRDSPCDPHELAPAPEARFLLQHHAVPTWTYPSPTTSATVHDSTAHSVSARAGIFAEYLGYLWPRSPCQRTQGLQLHFSYVGIVWAHSCCHSCFRQTFS